MAPKREDENGHDDGPLSKKPRVDGAVSAEDSKAALLEKARKTLEKQKEIAEKLQKLKALKQVRRCQRCTRLPRRSRQ
jgi:hypothetical protein